VTSLKDLCTELTKRRGSDLILKEGRPPLMRLTGQLLPSEHPPLDAQALWALVGEVIEEAYVQRLEQDREVDFGFEWEDVARFRANVFYQRSRIGCVIRAIPLQVPTIDELGLPPVLKDLANSPNGIVLVTGPTGSGKSTSLSAIVEHINRTRAAHVITIEDPIEFVYADKKATITQRSLGRDSLTIERALRAALRQNPDVILAGEMRDRATMELAMHAAETGHLVFSTLHTNDAKQSIDRILDTFPADARVGLLRMLAVTLRGIICQRLIPKTDGSGRIPAIEIMINSPSIRQLIEKGELANIQKTIEGSQSYYRMQSFNQALSELVRKRMITEEDAMANTTTPGDLKLMLKGMVRAGASAGTGALHKEDLDDLRSDAKPEGGEPAKPDPNRSGAVPKVVIPAPGQRTAGAGAPGQLRAPLRPTGRQGTPAAQRPATGANPQVRPAAPGAQPTAEGAPDGAGKPKIQRGFDFS
jgi:twitching motility protein PilT